MQMTEFNYTQAKKHCYSIAQLLTADGKNSQEVLLASLKSIERYSKPTVKTDRDRTNIIRDMLSFILKWKLAK